MDIHQKIRLVDDHIGKTGAGGAFLAGNLILTHNPPGFPNSGGGGGADKLAVLVAGELFPEEALQNFHLPSQLQFGGIDGFA